MVDSKSLLLTFLRKGEEEEKIYNLRRLSEDEWAKLLAEARRHKLGPILFQSLKSYYYGSDIPLNYHEQMRSIYLGTASRNMRLYRQLEEVLKKFAKEDIPVILLKGAHLAKYIYGNIALRPMADIDLLIRQNDLGKAHRLLIKDGYSPSEKFEEELPPYEKKGKIPLDIHSHLKVLPNKEYVDITALWTRAEKVNLGEAEALILSPEDLVLHLCVHNCNHHCLENGFISCFDIAHAAKFYKGKLDWNQLWARGQKWGIERAVYLLLALTEKTIGLPIPEQINRVMKSDYKANNVLADAEDLIFEQFTELSPNLTSMFSQKGWWKKYNILLQRIFYSEEMVKGDKKYLLYLSRLQSLFRTHRKTVWLGLRGDPQTVTAIETQNRRNNLREWLTHSEES